jgi:hypothetical protein
MLTATKYRQQGKECLELASRRNELYLEPLLLELAVKYQAVGDELQRSKLFTDNMLRRDTSH